MCMCKIINIVVWRVDSRCGEWNTFFISTNWCHYRAGQGCPPTSWLLHYIWERERVGGVIILLILQGGSPSNCFLALMILIFIYPYSAHLQKVTILLELIWALFIVHNCYIINPNVFYCCTMVYWWNYTIVLSWYCLIFYLCFINGLYPYLNG